MNQASPLTLSVSRAIPKGEPWEVTRRRSALSLRQITEELDNMEAPSLRMLTLLGNQLQHVIRVFMVVRFTGIFTEKTFLFRCGREVRG